MHTPERDADGNDTGEVIPCSVQSSSLNEELGQVNFVMSDKTGTLTVNKMEFRYLMIAERVYGNTSADQNDEMILDPDLTAAIDDKGDEGEKVRMALRCMSLCHDAVFDHRQKLNSSSPEELAFLEYCSRYGYVYQQPQSEQDGQVMMLEELGEQVRFPCLEKFEFNSDRKRMSVVLKFNEKVYLLTKGADDVLREQLTGPAAEEMEMLDESLVEAAQRGLRTMMLAYRVVEQQEWDEFHEKYKQAKVSDNAKEEVATLQASLEKELVLLGAIALEDRLQDSVPESIKFIRKAGVKFWVITGDKTETAISVGRSAGVVDNEMEVIRYAEEGELTEARLIEVGDTIRGLTKGQKVCSVVSGLYLTALEEAKKSNPMLYREFVEQLMASESAVFSRISPRQKQQVVRIVRDYDSRLVTLAIGDGANDVNMINAAHVGVGIMGVEGRQAARASDYNFGEFKHLVPLMFYFGRESYRKNATLILYNFYKNMLLVMPEFWFGFLNGFSGQSFYEAFIYQNFNIFFAFLPIFLFGIFDKTHRKVKFLRAPLLYRSGQDHVYFSLKRFGVNALLTTLLSLFLTLAALAFFDWGTYEKGYTYGFWNFGNMVFLAVVVIVNAKILSISSSYSFMLILFIAISLGMYFLMWRLLSFWHRNELFGTFDEILQGRHFYLFMVVVLGVCVVEYLVAVLDYHFNFAKYEAEQGAALTTKKSSRFDDYEHRREERRRTTQLERKETRELEAKRVDQKEDNHRSLDNEKRRILPNN